MPAVAQDPMVDLPWLPTRDTTGLRTLRVYRVDTLTGERKLAWTEDYDQHGFLADSLDKLTYDAQGHLLHEECNSTGYTDIFGDVTYRYDASGRRSAYRGYYYECSDSMDYVYDAQGVLTGMKGLFYDLGMEADVVVRCRPDGTRIEAWEYWREYVDDPEGPSGFKLSDDAGVYHMRYDERGALVYQKDPSGIMEYERVYW